jgi:hypothetical protein
MSDLLPGPQIPAAPTLTSIQETKDFDFSHVYDLMPFETDELAQVTEKLLIKDQDSLTGLATDINEKLYNRNKKLLEEGKQFVPKKFQYTLLKSYSQILKNNKINQYKAISINDSPHPKKSYDPNHY